MAPRVATVIQRSFPPRFESCRWDGSIMKPEAEVHLPRQFNVLNGCCWVLGENKS